jgi:ABC-type transport system involved in cytochrome c biogenesis permease subunit
MVGQIFLLFVVLLNAVASGDERYRPVATITSVVLSIASLALLTYSLAHIVTEWDTLDKRELANEFLMPIWLAGVSIPILYLAALYMGYETLFTRLTPSAGEVKVVLRARVGIVLGLRGGLVDIDQFRGASARDAARAHSRE